MRTLLLALLLLLAPTTASALQDPPTDGAVLELDGQRIEPDAYASWLLLTHGERLARVYGAEHAAVERAARAAGVDLPQAELEAQVQRDFDERIQHAFFGNLDEWRAEFARTGRTEAGARRQREVEARPFLLARKMAAIGRVVPEHKVVREWERLHGKSGRRYQLSMSFYLAEVRSPAQSGAEARKAAQEEGWSKARARALAARARIAAGEDFGKVARETSEDPDTRDGRGVPSAFRDEGWPKGFHEELAKLAVGELSQPLQAKGGWWLVKVREVRATPLEAARPEIVAMLAEKGPEPDEVGAILEPIHAGTKVEVLPQMWQAPSKGEQGGGDLPVMLVDGEPVGRAEYARFLLYWQGETALTRFVEDWAVQRKAAAAGVSVDEAEVRARVDEHIEAMIDEGFKRQREGWLAFLRRADRTEESFRASLAERWRIDLLAEKLMLKERVVDERAIRERYVAAYGAEGERFEVAWIVRRIKGSLPAGEPSREAVEAELARASEAARIELAALLARAKAGESFADLAREGSEDLATRDDGGRRPGRFRADSVPAELAAAVLAQPVGGETGPLLYGSAWVAFRVLERRKVSYEEAKAELAEELRLQRPFLTDIGSYRNTLAREVDVRILPGMAR
ncbi:MAG: hypothetical protein RIR65_567 [Planctomycetota bacterium]